MNLNDLGEKHGAVRSRKRVGRGTGSGLGKTSGKGQKGQRSRSGVALRGFEGGQMPLHMRLPKRGFNNAFARRFQEVNVGRIQVAIDAGKLDPKETVNVKTLKAAGVIRRGRDGVRLLGNGELKAKLTLEVAGASRAAAAAVEGAGGTLTVAVVRQPLKTGKRHERRERARAKARGEVPVGPEKAAGGKASGAPAAEPGGEEAEA